MIPNIHVLRIDYMIAHENDKQSQDLLRGHISYLISHGKHMSMFNPEKVPYETSQHFSYNQTCRSQNVSISYSGQNMYIQQISHLVYSVTLGATVFHSPEVKHTKVPKRLS